MRRARARPLSPRFSESENRAPLPRYLFDEFQTSRARVGSRRPPVETLCSARSREVGDEAEAPPPSQVETLLDTFTNIRDDEAEHVATMAQCQDPDALVGSPNAEAAIAARSRRGRRGRRAISAAGTLGEAGDDVGIAATDAAEKASSSPLLDAIVSFFREGGMSSGAARGAARVSEQREPRERRPLDAKRGIAGCARSA